ncbi:MAG: amino acid permease [Armatimonadota bacterium]|nr:amino acid permease [bacterium]
MSNDQSDNGSHKLTLFDACAMSIGGMLGGGIFSVVGESSALIGYSAWICLFLAGLLGLITGISYSELTLKYDEPGGSYTFVLNLAGRRIAGSLTWFLLLGYVFTNALYSYTFGAYAASLLGLGDGARGYLGSAAVLLLAVLNLIGIHEAAHTQNLLVYGKILILIVVIGAGAWTMRSGVPVVFVVVLSLGAAFLQFFSNLREVISYSSLVFFFIFGIVNLCAFVACDYSLLRRVLPGVGFLGCFAAAIILIQDLYEFRPASLWVIVGVSGMVLVLRLIYLYWYNCCVAEYRNS